MPGLLAKKSKWKYFSLILLMVLSACQSIEQVDKKIEKTYTDLKKTDVEDEEYLMAFNGDSEKWTAISSCAYVNSNGDTIVPLGKYSHCWTDTFKTFAIVYDEINTNSEIVAIDREENVLFDIVLFDNYPDELSDGLFRVKRNGKIGYANETGEIVIPCKYACAYWFEQGKAKVTYKCETAREDCEHSSPKSEEWFYIDKTGKRLGQIQIKNSNSNNTL